MAALGRKGAKKGGIVRSAKMTPEERAESARHAAQQRWMKNRENGGCKYYIVDYVPSITGVAAVPIGVICVGAAERGVAVCYFISDWQPVLSAQPRADVDTLKAVAKHVCSRIESVDSYDLVEQLRADLGNNLQMRGPHQCSGPPAEALRRLVREVLNEDVLEA